MALRWGFGSAGFASGGRAAQDGGMCRSIKTLRPPMTEDVTDEDIRAAALQYVRKVSGFRHPAAHNEAVFDQAVTVIANATTDLLADLKVRGARARP